MVEMANGKEKVTHFGHRLLILCCTSILAIPDVDVGNGPTLRTNS
jgi:hypothetical protein